MPSCRKEGDTSPPSCPPVVRRAPSPLPLGTFSNKDQDIPSPSMRSPSVISPSSSSRSCATLRSSRGLWVASSRQCDWGAAERQCDSTPRDSATGELPWEGPCHGRVLSSALDIKDTIANVQRYRVCSDRSLSSATIQ